jgi:putative transposase
MFAPEIRRQRRRIKSFRYWLRHLDEVLAKINAKTNYPWRAVDYEGEVLERYLTKKRGKRQC